MILKPAKEGLVVRHPDTKKRLKKEGEKVKLSTYWRRRLNEGSVVEVKGSSVPKPSVKKSEKKKDGGEL